MTPVDATRHTAELVELARRELHGESALSEEGSFARLESRMSAPKSRWAAGWVAGLGLALSAAAVASVIYRSSLDDHITFEVAGGAFANGQVVGGIDTRIRFSDGSVAQLSRGSEAAVENLTKHGAHVVLRRGTMRLQIAKKPHASWKVAAGPYDVQVTGTAFDVSWSAQEQTFQLRMTSGAVIVTGPMAVAGIPLKAGQHMFGGLADGRLTVEGGESVARTEPAPPEAAAAEPPALAPMEPPPAAPAPQVSAEAHSWTRQVAQGRFAAVIAEAEQRGIDRTLSDGTREELAALADAARYSGRAQIAKRVLLSQRQRFPSSPAARDAAFFLGRLAEESGGGAIDWYERYVAESPRGAYASQAFGRKMMLLYKQRGTSAAKPVASDYLSRYPNGPYAAAARKIDEESSRAIVP